MNLITWTPCDYLISKWDEKQPRTTMSMRTIDSGDSRCAKVDFNGIVKVSSHEMYASPEICLIPASTISTVIAYK